MNEIGFFNETNENITEIDEMKYFIDFSTNYLDLKEVEFNIIIVDNEKIHAINKEYRGIDRETDVISFALEDDKSMILVGNRVLGDIYISIDKAKEQANLYNHSLKRELCFLSIHGLLHLLGYDHMTKEDEEKMFSLQKEILDKYGITR